MIPLDDPIAAELYERIYSAQSSQELGEMRRQIVMRPLAEREEWEALLADMSLLSTQLNDTPVPPSLQAKLLNVMQSTPRLSIWQRAAKYQVGWKELAAVLVIAGALAAYFYWPTSPIVVKPLSDALSHQIAEAALQSHDSAPLEFSSGDVDQVLTRLQKHGYSFPPQVLHPDLDSLTLLGEGSTTFNGQPVAFTRWKQKDSIYTLYQFDGKVFELPPAYLQTVTTPRPAGPRVDIWQGAGGCAWALVADNSLPRNPFITYY